MKKINLLIAIFLSFILLSSQSICAQSIAFIQSTYPAEDQHLQREMPNETFKNNNPAPTEVIKEFKVASVNELLQSQNNDILTASIIPDLPADELMRKGKRKTIIGGVLAGLGGVSAIVGIAGIAGGSETTRNSENVAETTVGLMATGVGIGLTAFGVLLGGASIPFFARGSKLKRAARMKLNTGSLMVPQEFKIGQSSKESRGYVGLGVSLDL